MLPNVLLNANPETLHWIEFEAGTSNGIILSPAEAVLAKAMLQQAEQHLLANGGSLATGAHVERLRIALAPHKAVPTEVLDIIFQYTKPSTPFFVSVEPGKYAPLRFSHVCSRWRTICRSEPSFWDDALFVLGHRKNEAAHIKFWIENFVIDSRPLSLCISGKDRTSNPAPLHLLLSQQKVIRRLKIEDAKRFLGMPKHSFPLLEDLSLELFGDDLHPFQGSECFVGMGNLRAFAVKFSPQIHLVSLVEAKLPWSQLTSLKIDFRKIDDFLFIGDAVKLLERCKNLQKCTISVRNLHLPCSLTARLPELTDLVLISRRYDRNNTFSLTNCLIMPSLESLTISTNMIRMYVEPATDVQPDIGYLEKNSGHSIRRLVFRGYTVLSVDTDMKLERLTYLHTLEAPTTVFFDETINKIAQGILLPNIQILTLVIHSIESLEHLTELVEKKSSSSLPPILCITVMLLQEKVDILEKRMYIRAHLKRITACGSRLALRLLESSKDIDI